MQSHHRGLIIPFLHLAGGVGVARFLHGGSPVPTLPLPGSGLDLLPSAKAQGIGLYPADASHGHAIRSLGVNSWLTKTWHNLSNPVTH